MKRLSFRVWIGVALILISLLLLFWGYYPLQHQRRELRLFPTDMQLPAIHEYLPHGLYLA